MTFQRPALLKPRPPSASAGQSPLRRGRRRAASVLAGCFLIAQLVGSVPVAAAQRAAPIAAGEVPAAAPPAAAEPEHLPGVHYQDAIAHEDDRIEFTAGDRVSVGFRPRAGDTWPVGGRSARPLPAGSASGREMLPQPAAPPAAPEPSAASAPTTAPEPSAAPDEPAAPAASSPADSPVDAPTIDPSAVPQADGASARLPLDAGAMSLDGTRLRRQVFGFLPYWEVNSAVLDYEVLSTIAYFSVGSDKYGNLLKTNTDGSTTTGWSGWTSSRLTTIINAAHTRGTRVVLTLSVFAWTSGQQTTQSALLGSATARLNLAKQAAAAVRQRGADGINLDFEPIVSGYDDEFTAFVRTVRAELDKQAPGYQLTFDTTGYIGNYPLAAATAAGGADAIFIMGYDYRTAGTGYVGSIDPLSGPAYDLQDTVNAFAAKVAPSKLILGLPWYDRAWSTVSDQVNAKNQSGTQYGASNSVIYDTAADYANQYGRRWDSREQSPWVAYRRENCTATYGCVTSWRQIYYDDPASLKLRYDMVNRMGLRGAGIWALGYDAARVDMRQALAEKFLDDTTTPLAGIIDLALTQASETFPVSWVGSDESGVRDFDVQVSIQGGPWLDWLVDTAITSAWYAGADGYGFAFRVRARDTQGNVGGWNVLTASNTTVVDLPVGAVPAVGARFTGIAPVRLLDSRAGNGVSGPFTTGAARTFTVAGRGGVPAGATAVTGTFTVVGQTSAGYASLGPASATVGSSSIINTPVRDVRAVGVTVKLAASGTLAAMWTGAGGSSAHFVFDASGYFVTGASGATFVPLAPNRFLDTRSGNGLAGQFANAAPRAFQVAGRGGVPAGALAVTGNLTVVRPTSAGFLFVGPAIPAPLTVSSLNTPRGDIRAAAVTVKLDGAGQLAVLWKGAAGSKAHVLFDVTGYFTADGSGKTYFSIEPARLLDSRIANGLTGPFLRGVVRSFQATGRGSIPVNAAAVTGGVTVVRPTAAGYLVVGPAGTAIGTASNINLPQGDIRANSMAVQTGSGGALAAVFQGAAGSSANVILDATGYFR